MTSLTIRAYSPTDEAGWLRCRLLAFFDTCYYDDVKITKTAFDGEAIELVALDGGEIVAVLDIEIDGSAATIDTVATLPGHAGQGAATALLEAALPELRRRGILTLDAWTREDAAAIGWYTARSFVENFSYLHVYRQDGDPTGGFASPAPLSAPVIAFTHAPRDREAELRAAYARVYVCRQMLRTL